MNTLPQYEANPLVEMIRPSGETVLVQKSIVAKYLKRGWKLTYTDEDTKPLAITPLPFQSVKVVDRRTNRERIMTNQEMLNEHLRADWKIVSEDDEDTKPDFE